MPGKNAGQAWSDPTFVVYRVVQTSDFGGTASGKSPWLTLGMRTLMDGVLINAYKLMPCFVDKEAG